MIPENKQKVFLIGDKDGIGLSDVEACIKTTNYEIVGEIEGSFGKRDDVLPEEQRVFLESYNKDKNLIIITSACTSDDCETIAETFKDGDPTFAGPLAGNPLGIKTYHIMEPEIKNKIDPATYGAHVGIWSLPMNEDKVHEKLKSMRGE